MAREVQQKSLKYEKYSTSFIAVTLNLTVCTFGNLELNDVGICLIVFLCVLMQCRPYLKTLFNLTILIFRCVAPEGFENSLAQKVCAPPHYINKHNCSVQVLTSTGTNDNLLLLMNFFFTKTYGEKNKINKNTSVTSAK